jgi:hypothetical protein
VTANFARKTSTVPAEYHDSASVFYAILMQLQAWMLGVPILAVLGNDSVEATYFDRVLLFWVLSILAIAVISRRTTTFQGKLIPTSREECEGFRSLKSIDECESYRIVNEPSST